MHSDVKRIIQWFDFEETIRLKGEIWQTRSRISIH